MEQPISDAQVISEVVELTPAPVSVADKPPVEAEELKPLTPEEDMFCVALIETNGNVRAAYAMIDPEHSRPTAAGQRMLSKPNVAARMRQLMGAVSEQTYISLGTHLTELATIRDLSKATGNMKVALQAERARGEVAGYYNNVQKNVNTAIQINFASKHDANI